MNHTSTGWRVSLVTVVIVLVIQMWLAAMAIFVIRKIPALSVEIRQPSGHVAHEQLWRSLNNDDPVLGGIVDTWLIESLSFHPRVSLVHEVSPFFFFFFFFFFFEIV
jgi:hypothetical protein